MKLLVLLTLLIVASSVANAECPDHHFLCPTGESFSVGNCWNWSAWNCQTCRSIEEEMRDKCRQFSCDESVENWYGRNDGCSIPIELATDVFRGACGIHDICYATPNRTQCECDADFLVNLATTCHFEGVVSSVSYGICIKASIAAYNLVKNQGQTFPDFAANCQEII